MVPKAMCNPNQHQCRDGSDDRHDNEERRRCCDVLCSVLDSQNSLTLSFPTMFHFGDPNQTETRGGVELCKSTHTFKRKTKQEIDGDFEIEKQNRKRCDAMCDAVTGDGRAMWRMNQLFAFCLLFVIKKRAKTLF